MEYFFNAPMEKKKVVFIMGATGTGKSKLSIEIAAKFNGEIINSDKMQVYKGLDIVTNKLTKSEQQGIKHHLLSKFDPNSDFNARDFSVHAIIAIKKILKSGRIPIIVGGSNSFVEELVESNFFNFKSRFDCCFIWLDVLAPVLFPFVSKRVDIMVKSGLVEEVREIFDPEADYRKGIRRSIGVPELDKYLRAEHMLDKESKEKLLGEAIEEIKQNTCTLICNQLKKIHRLKHECRWTMHRIDATRLFEKTGEAAETAWWELVFWPSVKIVGDFLK